MPDLPISGLTAITAPAAEDLLAIVDDPSGTPVTRSITVGNLHTLPSYTSAGMNAISSPNTGLLVFNTDMGEPFFYDGSDWLSMIDGLPED